MHTILTPVLGFGFVVMIRNANASGTYDVDYARWSSNCNGVGQFPNENASYYGNHLHWDDARQQANPKVDARERIRRALGSGFDEDAAYQYQIENGTVKGIRGMVDKEEQ
ncbi:hypothetical protein SUNI508_10580 [Seiridium unicorne]|uniref:Uncharacterized protein n=1 Tax=Seiridium unicorne TaxID=138068 RepID=A0ABR2UL99_9PEZI